MSDPLATSILSKLTSWYTFDGDLNDSHGSYNLTEAVSVSGYSAGKKGLQVDSGSQANKTITTIPITPTTGKLTIGGWFQYVSGSADNIPEFGLAWGAHSDNEAFKIIFSATTGQIVLGTWTAVSGVGDNVIDPGAGAVNYPVRVRAQDSIGSSASSDQVIRISSSDITLKPGWYFVVGTWDLGNRILYVDSIAAATKGPPPSLSQPSITWLGIGRVLSGSGALTSVGCDECFFCDNAVLTAAEVQWLYNLGNGRSYAELVASA